LDVLDHGIMGAAQSHSYLQSRFSYMTPQFSPDGRFVVYTSNESGAYEVYVQPKERERKWQLSIAGGFWPRWRRDGKEIYYFQRPGQLLTIPVAAASKTFATGDPLHLFDLSTAQYDRLAGQSYEMMSSTSLHSRFHASEARTR
jgi:Tol biopolymer transport system component